MSIKRFTKVAASAAGALALTAGLSACGGGSSNGKGGAGSGTANGAVTQQGDGARLSGTYSANDFNNWLSASLYPSDITEIPNGAYSTSDIVHVNDKYNAASASCSTVVEQTSAPGFGEEAYVLDQGENAAATQFWAYAVYEFPTAADATAFVNEMAADYAKCGTFSVSSSGAVIQVSLSIGPKSETAVAAANEVVDLRQKLVVNGKTVVGDFVVSADGNVVLMETNESTTGTLSNEVTLDQVSEETLNELAEGEAKSVAAHSPSDYTTSTAMPTEPGSSDAGRVGGGVR